MEKNTTVRNTLSTAGQVCLHVSERQNISHRTRRSTLCLILPCHQPNLRWCWAARWADSQEDRSAGGRSHHHHLSGSWFWNPGRPLEIPRQTGESRYHCFYHHFSSFYTSSTNSEVAEVCGLVAVDWDSSSFTGQSWSQNCPWEQKEPRDSLHFDNCTGYNQRQRHLLMFHHWCHQ